MEDDTNDDGKQALTGLNNQSDKDTSQSNVKTQKIKSDSSVVGGIDVGAIAEVPLNAAEQSDAVDANVAEALRFKPIGRQQKAVETIAARLRTDFRDVSSYITARRQLSRRIDGLLHATGRGQSKIELREAIIRERLADARSKVTNDILMRGLQVNRNLLKFQTTTASTYMQQSLALQYKQLFNLKDLVKLTKAFAEMSESKLDAIKINTSLPNKKKLTIKDHIQSFVKKQAIKRLPGILEKETLGEGIDEALKPFRSGAARANRIIRVSSTGAKILDALAPKANAAAQFGRRIYTGATDQFKTVAPSWAHPSSIWSESNALRKFVGGEITKSLKPKNILNLVMRHDGTVVAENNVDGVGFTHLAGTIPSGAPPPMSNFGSHFETVTKSIQSFHADFNKFAALISAREPKVDLLPTISETAIEIRDILAKGVVHTAAVVAPESTTNAPPSASRAARLRRSGLFRRSITNVRNVGLGLQHFRHGFVDVYRKDDIRPGHPLVTRRQLARHEVVRDDGKRIRTMRDLNVPILDAYSGEVLITHADLEAGLVDVSGRSINRYGRRGAITNLLRLPFSMAHHLYFRPLAFLTRHHQRAAFVDVYLKGQVRPGHPLVTAEQLKAGLIFADGNRVKNVNEIDAPVLDPKTGQTLITEADLKTGLVDVFGKPIRRRRSRLSLIGAGLDFAKHSVSVIGRAALGLGKPLLSMYGSLFSTLSKTVLGAGALISKSIIGILSGKAPGAIAHGVAGIAGSIARMYSGMFGHTLNAVGGVGKFLFGNIFGRGGRGSGQLNKKDLYELVSVRLDHIYTLLDNRLTRKVRKGSYQDQENELKRDRAKLRHERDEEKGHSSGIRGLAGRIASLFGHKSGGGILSGAERKLEHGAEAGIGGFLLGKTKSAGSAVYRTARNIFSKGGGLATEGEEALHVAAPEAGVVAEDALKMGAKFGLSDLLKAGGKSLLKKIPGIGVAVGGLLALQRARQGDYTGAAAEMASGLVSLVPWVGTAASFGIDGWLAYRDHSQAKQTNLFTARLKIYGAQTNQAKQIKQIEARVLDVVVSQGKDALTHADTETFAKILGFNPKDTKQMTYVNNWLDHRFKGGFFTFLAILSKHKYNIAMLGTDVAAKDIPKIASEYTAKATSLVAQWSTVVPTLAAYKNSTSVEKQTAGIAGNDNTSTKSTTPSTPPPNPSSSQNLSTLQLKPLAPPPKGFKFIDASYTPGADNSVTPQTTAYRQGNYGPNPQAAQVTPAAAQIQELTYTRGRPTSNGSNYHPFNGVTLPNTRVPPTQALGAATRAMQAAEAASGNQQPVGHAYYRMMYGMLYAAAKAKGIAHPEVIAQLGAAQSSLETGWGRHIPGGNAFGIKSTAPSSNNAQMTHEFVNGRMITEQQNFRSYSSLAQSATDYISFLQRNGRYRQVLTATNIGDAIAAQAQSGYATDPNYGAKLQSVVMSVGGSPTNDNTAPTVQSAVYTPPITQRTPIGASPDGGAMTQPIPYRSTQGPASTLVAPTQAALVQTAASAPSIPEPMPIPTQIPVQMEPHPLMLESFREQSRAAQNSAEALNGLGMTMRDMYRHLQQVHSPNGLFGNIASDLQKQNTPSTPTTVIAPITNVNNHQCDEKVGFGVRKRRNQRYDI